MTKLIIFYTLNNSKIMKPTLLLGIAILLTGCGSYGSKTALGDTVYAPVEPAKVDLLFGPPDKPYKVIGVVSADGGTWTTPGQMYKKLIKCAADLGADAVIITGEGSYGTLGLPGTTTTFESASATAYGNTVDAYGNATTVSGPSYGAVLPRDKGLAIKFIKE
ncbi:MAG TPA: hypothetical protein VGZ93_12585 [Candidatus Methylacidiphilales bacterium]|jgi:hypothetical protein|nr:hypothetical protein [Candidatus Methylacidiphilales bacterium]